MSKKLSNFIMGLAFVMVIMAIAGNVWLLVTSGEAFVEGVFRAIFKIAALMCALSYIFLGCKKEGASYFYWFLIVSTICQFTVYLGDLGGIIPAIVVSISFGCLCILSFAKDLGKIKSFTIAGIYFTCSFLKLIGSFFFMKGNGNIVYTVTDIAISLVIIFCLSMKYADKSSRRTE